MKKIYLFLIALLVAFSANAKRYYIHGQIMSTGWTSSPELIQIASSDKGYYEAYVKASNANGNFGIKETEDNNTNQTGWCANGKTINSNGNYSLGWENTDGWDGKNLTWGLGTTNTYIVMFKLKEPALYVKQMTVPSTLYLIDGVGDTWNTNGTAMTKSGSTFTCDFNQTTAGTRMFQFSVSAGSTWNNVNANDRYGAPTADKTLTVGGTAKTLYAYVKEVDPGSSEAFSISNLAVGKYRFTVDFSDLTNPKVSVIQLADPTLTLNTPTKSNITHKSATVSYTFTYANFNASQQYSVYYTLDGGSEVFVTTFTGANGTQSGSFDLTSLQADKEYSVAVKVKAINNSSYDKTQTITVKTEKHPVLYMYYSEGANWGTFTEGVLESDNGTYVFNVTFAANSYATFSRYNEVGKDWGTINQERYGPTDTSKDTEIGASQLGVAQNLANNTSKSFKILEGGKYKVTVDFSGSTKKVTFEKTSLIAPEITFHETGTGSAAYHTATITSIYEGGKLYYTYDDPSKTAKPRWMRYFAAIQVSAKCEIWAYVETADGTSGYGTNSQNKAYRYDWETNVTGQLNKFRVKIADFQDAKNNNNRTLKITYEGGEDFAKDGYYGESPFSWAKYSDYKAFEKENAKNPEDLADYCDHLESNEGITFAYGPNVQDNRTATHVCRFFTRSYYRAYVQTHYEVAPVEHDNTFVPTPANSPRKYAAGQDEPQGNGVWNSVDGSTAGNVDPYATTRVAITAYTSPDDSLGTTGVEDIVTDDEAIDNDAPVIYYNLSGVRVVNPANGFYIRVQGSRAEKIYVK